MGSTGTPVIAVESGVVESLGWNQYGGWRIGIRSFDKKRYYYYAHLMEDTPYAAGLKEGDSVTGRRRHRIYGTHRLQHRGKCEQHAKNTSPFWNAAHI